VSFKFPIAFAACRNAIFNLLLPFGIRLLNVFPPYILLFGANLSQEANSLDVLNLLKP
jgi:hypothetical protein